jgi:hypothetical protein
MLRRVALVRADVSQELGASFIRVARIDELGTILAAATRATWRNVPEGTILHSHRRESLKPYTIPLTLAEFRRPCPINAIRDLCHRPITKTCYTYFIYYIILTLVNNCP